MSKFEKAVKEYNDIMNWMCLEHLTIGTSYSEDTEGWNLRDLVSEAQYHLDILRDPDCIEYQDAHMGWEYYGDREAFRIWSQQCKALEEFIKSYRKEALKMECTEGHCSEYD